MLELAYLHEGELNRIYAREITTEKYKYLNSTWYNDYSIEIKEDSWEKLQFVSIDEYNRVLGYFEARIDRAANYVDGLTVVSFYDASYIFSKDCLQFINDLFDKYGFNKINFSVFIGNPAEKIYDKYIEKYGGRVVGIFRNNARLSDGKLYDEKYYEIHKDDRKKNR